MATPMLPPTNSMHELRHRAQLYAHGLFPHQLAVVMPPPAASVSASFSSSFFASGSTASSLASSAASAPLMPNNGGATRAPTPHELQQRRAQEAAYQQYLYQQRWAQQAALQQQAQQAQWAGHPLAATQTISYRSADHSRRSAYSDASESDDGCSTCSGSRHGDSADDSPDRRRRPQRRSRRSVGSTASHADCYSCASSCSCESDSDASGDDARRNGMRGSARRHSRGSAGPRRSHRSSSTSRTARSGPAGGDTLRTSRSQHTDRSIARSRSRSPMQTSATRNQRHNRQRSQGDSANPKSVGAKKGDVITSPVAWSAVDLEGASLPDHPSPSQTPGLAQQARHAFLHDQDHGTSDYESVHDEDEAHDVDINEQSMLEAELVGAADVSVDRTRPAVDVTDPLHVTFVTPRDGVAAAMSRATHALGVGGRTSAEQQALHASALECLARAERGFYARVLTSAQAATSLATGPPPESVLRKLLRYEPRAGRAASSGGGNLTWYDLRITETSAANSASGRTLSKQDREEVRRMRELELDDLVGSSGSEMSEHDVNQSHASQEYARLLAQRKNVRLVRDRKAGIVPVRRIREVRAGIADGANKLVRAVNEHFAAIGVTADEDLVSEHCVSLLIDHGSVANAASSACEMAHVHGHVHARGHEHCAGVFAPTLCPRVPSSFASASRTANARVEREVRRNRRKLFGDVAPPPVPNDLTTSVASTVAAQAAASASFSGVVPFGDSFAASSSGPSSSTGHSLNTRSWVVVATASQEDATALLNALVFLKLLAGRRAERRTPSASPAAREAPEPQPHSTPSSRTPKRSKRAHAGPTATSELASRLPPTELTAALMSAAEHVIAGEESRVGPVRSRSVQRSFLKRKSAPTPSIKAVFPMPAGTATAAVVTTHPALVTAVPSVAAAKTNSRPASKTMKPTEQVLPTKSPPPSVAAQWAAAVEACDLAASTRSDRGGASAVETSLEPTVVADETSVDQTIEAAASPVRSPSVSPVRHPLASNTAIFTPSELAAAKSSPSSSVIPAAAPSAAPASVAEWLSAKAAHAERERRRLDKLQRAEAEAKAIKERETKEALAAWEARKAAATAKRTETQRRAKVASDKKSAEKHAAAEERRVACMQAFNAFLARADAKRKREARVASKAASTRTSDARRKKAAAKKNFEEWVTRKSEWFVERVRQIKQRARDRTRGGEENGQRRFGEEGRNVCHRRRCAQTNDISHYLTCFSFSCISLCVSLCLAGGDPEEEAALDWQWLEKEVEADLNAASATSRGASRSDRRAASLAAAGTTLVADARLGDAAAQIEYEEAVVADADRVLADGRTVGEVVASSLEAEEADADLLYGVLDEVDLALWTRLMHGVETARDEIARLKHAHPNDPAARALNQADRERAHAPLRVAFPTPLHALREEDGRLREEDGAADEFDAPPFASRPSPFATDAASVARESLLRTPGTYALQQLSADDQSQPHITPGSPSASFRRSHAARNSHTSPSRSGHHSRPMPTSARAPYASWLRGEMHEALGLETDSAQNSTAAAASPSGHARHFLSQRGTTPTAEQRYPVAAAAARSLHAPSPAHAGTRAPAPASAGRLTRSQLASTGTR